MEDLKTKSKKELQALLSKKRESLMKFRFKLSSGKTKNIKEGRGLRSEIARIITELNKDK